MVKTLWITVWQFLKNYVWPSYSTARYLPKGNESIYLHKDLSANVHSNFICSNQKQNTVYLSIHRHTGKQTVVYPYNDYSAWKKLMYATVWINLQIRLNGKSHVKKNIHCVNPFIHHSNSSLANSKAHKWLPKDEVGRGRERQERRINRKMGKI